jgi:hypothetical protein
MNLAKCTVPQCTSWEVFADHFTGTSTRRSTRRWDFHAKITTKYPEAPNPGSTEIIVTWGVKAVANKKGDCLLVLQSNAAV